MQNVLEAFTLLLSQNKLCKCTKVQYFINVRKLLLLRCWHGQGFEWFIVLLGPLTCLMWCCFNCRNRITKAQKILMRNKTDLHFLRWPKKLTHPWVCNRRSPCFYSFIPFILPHLKFNMTVPEEDAIFKLACFTIFLLELWGWSKKINMELKSHLARSPFKGLPPR